MTSVKEFCAQRLPQIVSQAAGRLNALFVTYNHVYGYENGTVNTGKSGLVVEVRSGYGGYSIEEALVLQGAYAEGDHQVVGLLLNEAKARNQQSQLDVQQNATTTVAELSEQSAPVLAVVYVGLSAMEQAIAYIRGLRQQLPQATIVALACDCDLHEKEFQFGQMIQAGVLNEAIFTDRCGGFNDMGAVLTQLIQQWPTT